METHGRKLYSVLTRKEVGEKMVEQIDQISEVFSLSKSDAAVILTRFRWNSVQASERLFDDKKKFLAELGLVKVWDLGQENESVSCIACHRTRGDGDYLVSTPVCSHKFCTTCWRYYLNEFLMEKEGERIGILCPHPGCIGSVGPDTVKKLVEPVQEMYKSYVLASFMESNKETIKWCPATGCHYAIERHEDVFEDDESCLDYGGVCLCGHTFCWSCQLESHRPVTCNNASLWSNRELAVLNSIAWINEYIRRCPRCNSRVHRNDDPNLRLLTCICRYRFCWRCFRSEEEHNGKWNCVQVSVPPNNQEKADSYGSRYSQTKLHYLNLWNACHEGLEIAKTDLKVIEENVIPKLTNDFGLRDEQIGALKEAWLLIVQCKLVMKWSCAFEYFMNEYQSAKTQYLKHLRDEATKTLLRHRATLEELINQALSSGDFSSFKLKLSATTTTTSNYFHEFVKTLEDSPLPPPNNNTASVSSSHRQVPNDPFARQGETNPSRVE